MPTLTVMSPKCSIAIATCLPVVYYGYIYLQSTMATCSLLWLPVIYYMATCSLLWPPVVHYVYL